VSRDMTILRGNAIRGISPPRGDAGSGYTFPLERPAELGDRITLASLSCNDIRQLLRRDFGLATIVSAAK
jgi:hypothetical protein